MIEVYTDGSVISRGVERSCGGWACKLIYNGHSLMKSGGKIGKTNNQMEIYAVLEAMRAIKDKNISVTVYSDSSYVVGILNNRFTVRANAALWDQAMQERQKFRHIRFVWVKGHDGNPNNEEVDWAAHGEAKAQRKRMREWQKAERESPQKEK